MSVRNVAREKLEAGHLSLGVGVRLTRSVEIGKAMAVAGFDWLFLDMEHGVMSLDACAQICVAALDAGIAPIARAISTAGGISFDELDADFMIRRLPGVFAAGEMLDWEAPTGGYLLQACFATGLAAGQGALRWLDVMGPKK